MTTTETHIKRYPSVDCPQRHRKHDEHVFRLTFSMKGYNGAWIDCAGYDGDEPGEPQLYYVRGKRADGTWHTVKTYALSKSAARDNARWQLFSNIGPAVRG